MIKSLIKKIVSGGHGLSDYVPAGISKIQEQAFIQVGGEHYDVTNSQFTLAYNPLVIGIALPSPILALMQSPDHTIKLYYTDERGRIISELFLKYNKIPDQWEDQSFRLVLFHITQVNNFQLSLLQRNVILWIRYLRSKSAKKYFGTLPLSLHKQYAAVFSFPRRVVLAAVKENDACIFFPIDLHGQIPSGDCYVWGIRHSNKGIAALLITKKIVIADIAFSDYESIYALGKFKQEGKRAHINNIITQTFNYTLPEFVLGYKEIELLHHEDIGSQRLFIGKIIATEQLHKEPLLHHIHFLRFLSRKRNNDHEYIFR